MNLRLGYDKGFVTVLPNPLAFRRRNLEHVVSVIRLITIVRHIVQTV